MRQRTKVLTGLSAGITTAVMFFTSCFSEVPQELDNTSVRQEQAAAVAFFNQVALESSNPYIVRIAREGAERLGRKAISVTPAHYEIPVISQPDNSVAVPAMVNSKTVGTFIIDTGSSYTVITPRMAAKLGVQIHPDTPRVSIITANGPIQAPIVTLNNVSIGEVQVNNVQAVVQDLSQDLMLSGLLGMNFFKGRSLTIQQDRLILGEAASNSINDGTVYGPLSSR